MKIIEFEFIPMPDSAQFCTEEVIYAFHEEGFIEFMAYCMINSFAQPLDIEIEEVGENSYICHVLTVTEMIVMSERCIMVKGRLECKEVNQQLEMTVRQRILEKK